MAPSQCQSDPWIGIGTVKAEEEGPPGASAGQQQHPKLSPDLQMTFATEVDIGHNSRLALGLSEHAI